MIKERLRKAIARQTQEYLDAGGMIKQVPRVIFCPANMHWARKRGWDYMPWTQLGGADFFAGKKALCEGCYETLPKNLED
jgi:hypothetical protein